MSIRPDIMPVDISLALEKKARKNEAEREPDQLVTPGDIIVVNTNLWYHSTRIEGEDISLVITNEFD